MQDEVAERKVEQIKAMLRELGRWPDEWGEDAQETLLDLYKILEAPYQAAGKPFGDTLEGLARWWREGY